MYRLTGHLLDATNVYVGLLVNKQIFMEMPTGVTPDQTGQVCKLLQSLYSLKQSAYLWQEKMKKFLTSHSFRQTSADASVYTNECGIIIAVYMDDILILSKSSKNIDWTKSLLQSFHQMKDSGHVTKILGIHVTWCKDGSIQLDQEFYARSILMEFGMLDCKPKKLPLAPSVNLENAASKRLSGKQHGKFCHIISKLTYLAGRTQIDIYFLVN